MITEDCQYFCTKCIRRYREKILLAQRSLDIDISKIERNWHIMVKAVMTSRFVVDLICSIFSELAFFPWIHFIPPCYILDTSILHVIFCPLLLLFLLSYLVRAWKIHIRIMQFKYSLSRWRDGDTYVLSIDDSCTTNNKLRLPLRCIVPLRAHNSLPTNFQYVGDLTWVRCSTRAIIM